MHFTRRNYREDVKIDLSGAKDLFYFLKFIQLFDGTKNYDTDDALAVLCVFVNQKTTVNYFNRTLSPLSCRFMCTLKQFLIENFLGQYVQANGPSK